MDFVFSPLDRRYKKAIPAVLSEEASFTFQVQVEALWLKKLRNEGICPSFSDSELDNALMNLSYERVEEIEKKTQHATRALVEAIAEAIDKAGMVDVAKWVHVGLTSFDVVDTAARLRLKSFVLKDYLPALEKLEALLSVLAKKHENTLQAGRTHGQWAVPTYFGLSVAEALIRIRELNSRLKADTNDLRGQASGAIGGYHALSLLTDNPVAFERDYIATLGLKPHYGCTQIIPPEDMIIVAQDVYLISSVLAKVATDWRHLARSEIAEIFESMGEGQVGSSTMPQKRNPWNLEHVCSLFKVLKSKLFLLEDDVISEHQRDLTNSASSRFYFEFFAVSYLMLDRFTNITSKIQVDEKNMAENFKKAGSSIYAEALYVSLTKEGRGNAHDLVREASRESEAKGIDLLDVLKNKKLINSSLTQDVLTDKVLSGTKQKLTTILGS